MKCSYLVWEGANLSADVLRELGGQGWEMVSLIVLYLAPHREKAGFKRPKATP